MSDYRQAQCQKMLDALNNGAGIGMTRANFADLLGIKKSQHLYGLIDELVSRNLAEVKYGKNAHNRPIFIYFPLPQEQPKRKRKVVQE